MRSAFSRTFCVLVVVLLAALMFGFFGAVGTGLQAHVSADLTEMLPYIITIIMMIFVVVRRRRKERL